ncbi:MAG TPA: sigma-54 dependent transcriptional regulator [Williamwhitmania sp.]|nr:sigma-54 dependent transcriptional regulator [Williamwhitmania sp.]
MENEFSILIIDDNKELELPLKIALRGSFSHVEFCSSPTQAIEKLKGGMSVDVVLLDMNFSQGKSDGEEGLIAMRSIHKVDQNLSVVVFTAYGDIDLAVKAMKLGAADFVVKPWDNLKLEATLVSAARLTRLRNLALRSSEISSMYESEIGAQYSTIVGSSRPMLDMMELVHKVAPTDANVMITGENGAGKELVARMVHRESKRKQNPFIAVDMGAIPETLFESEIFGHEKGAFTDANITRIGRMELADGGTLFLDEIANLSLPLQAKLLRAIQSMEVQRLGAIYPKHVNVRIICATNANLWQLITQGKFREDLFFRLNTVEISVPPLRNREGDISILAGHFLLHFAEKYGKRKLAFSKESLSKLLEYGWPGNVRELGHVVERAVIVSEGNIITPEHIAIANSRDNQQPATMWGMEKDALEAALKRNGGNVTAAAHELDLGRTTLYRKMKRYGL